MLVGVFAVCGAEVVLDQAQTFSLPWTLVGGLQIHPHDLRVISQYRRLLREGWRNPNHFFSSEGMQWVYDVDPTDLLVTGFVEPGSNQIALIGKNQNRISDWGEIQA